MNKLILLINVCIVFTAGSQAQTGWVQQNSGTSSNLNCVFFIDTNTGYAVGNSVILKTTNGGSNWSSQSSQTLYSVFFLDVNTGYIGGVNYIYKTTNGGTNWNISYYNINLLSANSIYFNNSLTGIAAGTWYIVKLSAGIILRTTDGGITWNSVLIFNPGAFLSVNFPDPFTGYTSSPFYKTTNSGQSWNQIQGPFANSIYFINTITGWTVTNSASYNLSKTTNGGNNWTSYTLPNSLYSVHFTDDQTGWVCGSNGVIYGSTDGGINWSLQSAFTTTYLYSMCFVNAETGWAVGAGGRILKTTTGGITLIKPISNEIPQEFKLYQNFPNPFNPSTKLNIQIAKLSEVKIIIYDILGKEVTTLINEQLKPGSYEVEWDGSNYTSGVYYYRLSAGDYMDTKKMVLIK